MSEQTRALRDEIRDTRERMSGTLDELSERLNPQRLRQHAKDSVRDATIGRVSNMANNAGHTMMDTIRENPIPTAMVGIGLGWLLFNARSGESVDQYRERYGLPYRGDIGARTPRLQQDDAAGGIGASTSPSEDTGRIQQATSRVRSTIDDATQRAHETTDRVRERVDEKTAHLRDRVTETRDHAAERAAELKQRTQYVAHEVADTTRVQAQRLEQRFQSTMYENPLAIGLAAAAVGLAAGMAIPETRRESELMGHARDRTVERAREKAEELGEKVQHVAERTVEDVKTHAREEGLNT